MKKILISLLLLLPLISTAAKKTTPDEVDLDRIAAIVNDEVITESTLNAQMEELYAQMMHMHRKLPSENVLRKSVLNQLINKTLQLQIAKRNNVTISDVELNKAIESILKQNHMDRDQLKKAMSHQGITEAQFQKQMRETLTIQKLQQSAVSAKINITDAEVDKMLKEQQGALMGKREYHLSHILLPLPEEPTTQQLQKTKLRAQQLYRKLLNGADFSKIASENSSSEALEGGDLGWRKFAELPSIFTEQIKHMKVNDVVGPIKAPNGYHIIKLVGVKKAGNELSKSDIKNMIYQRKIMDKVKEWMDKVRSVAYIKII